MKLRMSVLLMFLLVVFVANQSFTPAKKKAKIQIALLLDTSNSMDGLIDQAKSQLWKIVNEMATAKFDGETPNLEIALYEYGNDGLSAREGYIRQVAQMTTDLDKISEDLFALKTNGGSEFCGQVIDVSLKQLLWSASNDDLKMIFIAGNEPFNQGGVDYKKSCKKSISKGIIVNTIFCGDYQQGINTFWKDGADLADGKYMNIDQDRKVVHIPTPFDDPIVQLNKKLNKTYIGYGSQGKKMKERQITQDNNASSMGAGSYVNRAMSKSSQMYKNEQWDLVDAVEEDEEKLDKITDDELPEELKGKSKEEIKVYVDEKKKERENINKQIQVLNKKRTKFIAEKRKENAEELSLDKLMINTVKDQAKKKNYKFK